MRRASTRERGTRDRILDAAEHLFAEHGFAGTSLRSITQEAGVNLAAVNYHFGSKEALLTAVLARRIEPINRERLRELDALEAEAGDGPLELGRVLRAFLGPALRMHRQWGKNSIWIMQLAGRMHTSPDDEMRPAFMELFREIRERFLPAFQRALPGVPEYEVFWRLHFVIGALAHTLVSSALVEQWYRGGKAAGEGPDTEAVLERLLCFAEAGMAAPCRKAAKEAGKTEGGGS